mgnify:CR=1 FL=1
MRLKSLKTITGLILALCCLPMAAEELPVIKKTSQISVGTLPNNVRFYLAENSTTKGYANFTLVQKGVADVSRSRRVLRKLPHFVDVAPYQFLSSKGIGYGPDGYVSYPDGNTVFSFNDVPTFDAAACDSTILLIFDLVNEFDGEQAVVVCGDISRSEIEAKLHVFSLNVSPRNSLASRKAYSWEPSENIRFVHTLNNTRNLVELSFIWDSPRTPQDRMNTPQPLVSYMYAQQLGHVLRKRVSRRFMRDNIPLSSFDVRYSDSAASSGDERFTYSISVDGKDLNRAVHVMAAIFSELDSEGASWEEFNDAKNSILSAAAKRLSTPVTNSMLTDECKSSFLYGSNMPASDAVLNFFKGRKLPQDKDLSLFNSFVSALLDSRRALTIHCDSPRGEEINGNAILSSFVSSWGGTSDPESAAGAYKASHGDTLSLISPRGHRVKVKSETTDPVSGGTIWSFSNGTRVIFKKTSQKGFFYYGLMLKGGYSYVPEIGFGESAFVGDMMSLYKVGGMAPNDFHNMLDANGINLSGMTSLTDLQLVGSAPVDKLDLLMRALLTYSRDRVPDKEAFDYYRACEKLRQERTRLSNDGIIAAIDSTMCPDYYYPDTKSVNLLREDLPERVNAYLSRQFSKFNDGLLLIIGDFDSGELKSVLGKYLGNFSVSDAFSVRPKVEYNLRGGWSTYNIEASRSSVGSGEVCVNVGMATCTPFTIKSYNAFLMASTAMKRNIISALSEVGMHVDVSMNAQAFPAERLSFFITCRPCAVEGLPEGITPAGPLEVLGALRSAISGVYARSVTPGELAGLKTTLLNGMANHLANPDFLTSAVMMRNSECKDVVSNYKESINSVTLEDVNSVLHDLDFGTRVEYVIH